jgi:hypothetical protein
MERRTARSWHRAPCHLLTWQSSTRPLAGLHRERFTTPWKECAPRSGGANKNGAAGRNCPWRRMVTVGWE